MAARDHWLNPPELVEHVPEVVPGFPDRLRAEEATAEAVLRKRTLTASTTSAARRKALGWTRCIAP